jgi:NADPH:quinone reductase-like Zn-dependent oxidoreductase
MKAAFIEQFGEPEVLRYGNLPDPVAAPGEVVIDVVAGQRADWKVRVGQYKQSKFPFVLGRDFSGLISAVGEGVMDLKLGDAVFGVCEAGQEGAYAEKIAVKAAAALMLSTDEYHVASNSDRCHQRRGFVLDG